MFTHKGLPTWGFKGLCGRKLYEAQSSVARTGPELKPMDGATSQLARAIEHIYRRRDWQSIRGSVSVRQGGIHLEQEKGRNFFTRRTNRVLRRDPVCEGTKERPPSGKRWNEAPCDSSESQELRLTWRIHDGQAPDGTGRRGR